MGVAHACLDGTHVMVDKRRSDERERGRGVGW